MADGPGGPDGLRYGTVCFDLYGTLVDIRTDETSDAAWDALREALARDCDVTFPHAAALRERFTTLAAPLRARAVATYGECADPDLLPVYAALAAGASAASDATVYAATGDASGAAPDSALGREARHLAWAFRRASTSLLRLYPGAADTLSVLRRAGARVVLVSNAQSAYTCPELDLLGLTPLFDHIVISSEEGVRKPSPALYRIAMARAGAEASRMVMVGNDERSDIIGARAAGIDGIYMRTAISPPGAPRTSTHAVRSLDGSPDAPDYAGLLDYLGV
ncbi:HAD family hydrolase [Bifidobacterium aesculapii]|uniref:HAD family hydrolase n=1 Tax=Bifidobacterium aesculapii TaxID=1329411 RepID=UPI001F4433AE|nr:HAD family hydrolase [Bifidobacterium aesculapii]